jgi:uncharacterized protein YecE (DUF72 family)
VYDCCFHADGLFVFDQYLNKYASQWHNIGAFGIGRMINMRAGKVHIGTSGWSYKHWQGLFYPPDLAVAQQLPYYSSRFDTTEINSSFYRLPSPATVQHWQESVKKTFRFCPKISRWVTHAKKLNDPESSVPRFFDVFDPYRQRCGPVLVQLPAKLAFKSEKAAHFFSYLHHTYKQWSFSLEARHASWMSDESLALLIKYKIGWVIAESGDRWASSEIITAKHIYLRFHGPDGSYASSYPDTVLRAYARKCAAWLAQGHDLWVFFNNDLHGYAIQNAIRLRELIEMGI